MRSPKLPKPFETDDDGSDLDSMDSYTLEEEIEKAKLLNQLLTWRLKNQEIKESGRKKSNSPASRLEPCTHAPPWM